MCIKQDGRALLNVPRKTPDQQRGQIIHNLEESLFKKSLVML